MAKKPEYKPYEANEPTVTVDLREIKALLNAIEYFGIKDKVEHSWNAVNEAVGEVVKQFPQPK